MDKTQLLEQLQNDIQQNLDRLSARLIQELKPIVQIKHAADTFLLFFEGETQDLTHGFAVYWFVLDKDLLQMGEMGLLLSDIPSTVPRDIIEDKQYKQADIGTWDVSFDLLIQWFGKFWREAGGLECQYPVYIGHHDAIDAYNLNTMEKVEL